MARYFGRAAQLAGQLRSSAAVVKVGNDSESAVQSVFRSRSFFSVAGERMYSNVSEGLRPKGPLAGTKLGPSGSGDNITESGDLSSGILKSRATGKAGLSKDEAGTKQGPFSDKNTEEKDDVAATEGAEGPRDFAEKVKKNDEANTASMKEDAKNSPDEFKSPLS